MAYSQGELIGQYIKRWQFTDNFSTHQGFFLCGRVVPYFTILGYVDPVDLIAQRGLIGAAVVFALLLLWSTLPSRKRDPQPRDPLQKSVQKVVDTEEFAKAAKDRVRKKIDIEDARQNDQN